ncbi:MAG: Tad domain-containing protein [Planctomycetota bacterium]
MVLALMGLVMLAALVFYMFNVGHQVTRRVETQNAADNAALSGSRWMARSFNTVAMNNVESARMIALAGVLDAVPQAVDYTLRDQEAFVEALDDQLARGNNNAGWLDQDPWLEAGMREARAVLQGHVSLLRPVHELLNESGYDVARMTFFEDSNGARGELWQALESLSALSEASLENLGVLTAYSAYRGAQISQREAGLSSGGLLLPWEPSVPWEQGAFDDFRAPVVDGLLPEGQDDKETNRGPFDTVFGFWQMRSTATRRSLDVVVEQDFGLTRWAPQPPTEEIVARDPTAYSTWGTYTDMRATAMELGVNPQTGVSSSYIEALRRPADADEHPLVPSQWARRVGFIADQKINNAFPGAAAQRVIREPNWITDYEGGIAIAESGSPDIAYGAYLVFEYRRSEFGGATPTRPTLENWGLLRVNDDFFNPPGLIRIAEHIWRDERIEGFTGVGGEQGRRRLIRYYVYLGINVGPVTSVRNPYNFNTTERGEMPGPINFVVEDFPPTEQLRRDRLTFMGVAHQPREAAVWSAGFDGDRPEPRVVALAQAEVFNNHSWDLWTQMWHAQLTPIDDLDGWLEVLAEPENLDEMPWLEEDEIAEVTDYLNAAQPLMQLMLEDSAP